MLEEELTALTTGIAGGRVYWGRAKQTAAKPYVTLSRVSGGRDYHNRGASGLVESRVQADVYADTYTAAVATGRALVALLSGYRGGTIKALFIDSQRDLPAADAGEVTNLFRVSIDLILHHSEN